MWFMTRFYTAAEAEKMGLVNTVVPVSLLVKRLTKSTSEIFWIYEFLFSPARKIGTRNNQMVQGDPKE